jgi:hypothetical protein
MKHSKFPFKIALFLLCIFAFQACKKKDNTVLKPYVDPYYIPSAVDSVWRSKLTAGNFSLLNSNNDVVVSGLLYDSVPVIKLLDGVTGQVKWSWDDYEKGYGFAPEYLVFGDHLILGNGRFSYAVNMLTGNTIWKHKFENLNGVSRIFKDDEYFYQELKNEKNNYETFIYRTKYNQLNWQLVCTFQDSTLTMDRLSIYTMTFSKNESGQKLLVFPISNNASGSNYIYLCAYNTVTNKYEWIQDFTEIYNDFGEVYANENKIFAIIWNGDHSRLVAFNSFDGSVVWDKELEQHGTSFYLYNDKIIVSVDQGVLQKSTLLCLSQNSGSVVWQADFNNLNSTHEVSINFNGNDQTYYKNYLFSAQCKNLLIVDLNNGSVFFNKQAAFRNGCLSGKISINEQQAWFYANDGYYANCYKLPTGLKFN